MSVEKEMMERLQVLAEALTTTVPRKALFPSADMENCPPSLVHLYEGETDPLYLWPNTPRGDLPW